MSWSRNYRDYLPKELIKFFGFVKGVFKNRPLRYMMAIFVMTWILQLSGNIRYIIANEDLRKEAHINNVNLLESAKRLNAINTLYSTNSRKLDSVKAKLDYVQMQLMCERNELEMVRDTLYKLK